MKFVAVAALAALVASANAKTTGVGSPECVCTAHCTAGGFGDVSVFDKAAVGIDIDKTQWNGIQLYANRKLLPDFEVKARTFSSSHNSTFHQVWVESKFFKQKLFEAASCSEGKVFDSVTGSVGSGDITVSVKCVKTDATRNPSKLVPYHLEATVTVDSKGSGTFLENEGEYTGLCAARQSTSSELKGVNCRCDSTCGSSAVGDELLSYTNKAHKSEGEKGEWATAYTSSEYKLSVQYKKSKGIFGMGTLIDQVQVVENGTPHLFSYNVKGSADTCKSKTDAIIYQYKSVDGKLEVQVLCANSSGLRGRTFIGFRVKTTRSGGDVHFADMPIDEEADDLCNQ